MKLGRLQRAFGCKIQLVVQGFEVPGLRCRCQDIRVSGFMVMLRPHSWRSRGA